MFSSREYRRLQLNRWDLSFVQYFFYSGDKLTKPRKLVTSRPYKESNYSLFSIPLQKALANLSTNSNCHLICYKQIVINCQFCQILQWTKVNFNSTKCVWNVTFTELQLFQPVIRKMKKQRQCKQFISSKVWTILYHLTDADAYLKFGVFFSAFNRLMR